MIVRTGFLKGPSRATEGCPFEGLENYNKDSVSGSLTVSTRGVMVCWYRALVMVLGPTVAHLPRDYMGYYCIPNCSDPYSASVGLD